jgi:leader peptidase (prepilin peptidase)/N-methyltransferase
MPLEYLMLIFVTLVGACVGSFLNVVVYRLPHGLSVVKPASRCPACGKGLAWYDNVPVLAWFYLRGKCRQCGAKISFQYPLVEAATAALFGGWFALAYFTQLRPEFADVGMAATWPMMVAYLLLWAGLLAATLIDAKYYIIPLSIPWWIIAAAVVAAPVALWLAPGMVLVRDVVVTSGQVMELRTAERCAAPLIGAGDSLLGMAAGGAAGLVAAMMLVWRGVLPRSFADLEGTEHEELDKPETWVVHPHPRREVMKEALFVAVVAAGAAAGGWLLPLLDGNWAQTLWLRGLGGAVMGLLVGGGVIWVTRIGGTLAFGKEAMGLGDVHLMAAVGAVCGWRVAVLTFFIAPFIGLSYTVAAQGAARLLKREVRVIPYGPHLAAAALACSIFREILFAKFGILLGV